MTWQDDISILFRLSMPSSPKHNGLGVCIRLESAYHSSRHHVLSIANFRAVCVRPPARRKVALYARIA